MNPKFRRELEEPPTHVPQVCHGEHRVQHFSLLPVLFAKRAKKTRTKASLVVSRFRVRIISSNAVKDVLDERRCLFIYKLILEI